MRRSTDRILTTHAGSLPNPEPGLALDTDGLAAAVTDVIERQREAGLDLINEGEYTKGGDWLSFADDRFGGFAERERKGPPMIAQARIARSSRTSTGTRPNAARCSYDPGRADPARRARNWSVPARSRIPATPSRREIELLTSARAPPAASSPRTAPASLEVYRANEHYATEEQYLVALAGALREEYELIVAPALFSRSTTPGCPRSGTASASAWAWRPSAAGAWCALRR